MKTIEISEKAYEFIARLIRTTPFQTTIDTLEKEEELLREIIEKFKTEEDTKK